MPTLELCNFAITPYVRPSSVDYWSVGLLGQKINPSRAGGLHFHAPIGALVIFVWFKLVAH